MGSVSHCWTQESTLRTTLIDKSGAEEIIIFDNLIEIIFRYSESLDKALSSGVFSRTI